MLNYDRARPALLLVCALAVLSGACQSSTPASAPAPPPVSPDVWAVVDGREIRRDDVEKAYRRTAGATPVPSEDEALAAKLTLLDEYIVEDILLAKGRELNVTVTDAELDTAFAEAKKDIPDDAFTKELAQRNLTATDMRDGMRRDLTARKVIEREVSSKVNITDQDVSDFFQANRAQFNLPEDAYRIAQIVVTPAKEAQIANRTGDDAATQEQANAKAQMLMQRLGSGTSFGDLAMDFSEDPQSAARGGDVGLIPVSSLRQAPPQLRDAVMKSTPGDVKLVSIGGGHTIVLLIAKEAAGQRDLSMPDVRQRITDTLRGRREQLMRTAYLAAARNKATVVNHIAQRLVESQGKLPTLAPAAPGSTTTR